MASDTSAPRFQGRARTKVAPRTRAASAACPEWHFGVGYDLAFEFAVCGPGSFLSSKDNQEGLVALPPPPNTLLQFVGLTFFPRHFSEWRRFFARGSLCSGRREGSVGASREPGSLEVHQGLVD